MGRLRSSGGPPETCGWVLSNRAAGERRRSSAGDANPPAGNQIENKTRATGNSTPGDAGAAAGGAKDTGGENNTGGASAEESLAEERAVLKLQHAGVDSLMRRDMVSALRIARLMRWLDPK